MKAVEKTVENAASVLERELGSITADWLKQVNLIPTLTNIALSDEDRTGHLPQLFKELIARLRLDSDVEPTFSMAAADHGGMRFVQGYSVSMLVEESRIFQVSTFGTLQVHQNNLDQNRVPLDVITIADEADRQLTQSVRSFMAAEATAYPARSHGAGLRQNLRSFVSWNGPKCPGCHKFGLAHDCPPYHWPCGITGLCPEKRNQDVPRQQTRQNGS